MTERMPHQLNKNPIPVRRGLTDAKHAVEPQETALVPTEVYWWRVVAFNSLSSPETLVWSDWLKVAQISATPEQVSAAYSELSLAMRHERDSRAHPDSSLTSA